MCMSVLAECMFVKHTMPGSQRRHQISGTGVTDSPKLLCRYWELNLNPLGEQPLTTAPTKSFNVYFMSHVLAKLWEKTKNRNQPTNPPDKDEVSLSL